MTEFLASDSWILLSIILISGNNGARLKDLIPAADGINHAIPTFEEIEGALARLTTEGFISQEGDAIFVTEKTKLAFDDRSRESIRTKWKKMDRVLKAKPWDKGSSPRDANRGVSYDGINRAEYERAVSLYLKKARHSK